MGATQYVVVDCLSCLCFSGGVFLSAHQSGPAEELASALSPFRPGWQTINSLDKLLLSAGKLLPVSHVYSGTGFPHSGKNYSVPSVQVPGVTSRPPVLWRGGSVNSVSEEWQREAQAAAPSWSWCLPMALPRSWPLKQGRVSSYSWWRCPRGWLETCLLQSDWGRSWFKTREPVREWA